MRPHSSVKAKSKRVERERKRERESEPRVVPQPSTQSISEFLRRTSFSLCRQREATTSFGLFRSVRNFYLLLLSSLYCLLDVLRVFPTGTCIRFYFVLFLLSLSLSLSLTSFFYFVFSYGEIYI